MPNEGCQCGRVSPKMPGLCRTCKFFVDKDMSFEVAEQAFETFSEEKILINIPIIKNIFAIKKKNEENSNTKPS